MSPAELVDLLRRHRYRATCETDLQQGIEQVLATAGLPFEREVQLSPKDRPDFLISDHLAVELKVDGSAPAVVRQLQRYAQSPRVSGLVLVTTRQRHMRMPATLSGKPLACLFVGRL